METTLFTTEMVLHLALACFLDGLGCLTGVGFDTVESEELLEELDVLEAHLQYPSLWPTRLQAWHM